MSSGRRSNGHVLFIYKAFGRPSCRFTTSHLIAVPYIFPATMNRPAFNLLAFAGPTFLQAVVLALDVSFSSKLIFFFGFSLVTLLALYSTTGDKLQDYTIGNGLSSNWITALTLLFFVNPIREYRHRSDTKPPADYSLVHRVYWCLCVIFSVRGVGWNDQVGIIELARSTTLTDAFTLTVHTYPRHETHQETVHQASPSPHDSVLSRHGRRPDLHHSQSTNILLHPVTSISKSGKVR